MIKRRVPGLAVRMTAHGICGQVRLIAATPTPAGAVNFAQNKANRNQLPGFLV